MKRNKKGKGWHGDIPQHRLAGRGIKTVHEGKKPPKTDGNTQKIKKVAKGRADDRFWLGREIEIYVPSTQDVDEDLTDEEFRQRIKNVQQEFSEEFGGTTTFLGDGTYVDQETGDLIEEHVAVVEVHMSDEDWQDKKEDIFEWLEKKKEQWEQQAISFEFEGDLTFV